MKKYQNLRNVAKIGVACLAAMTMFQGCKTDEPTPKNITITDGQTNQTVYANENSGSSGVSFTTTGAWASSITTGTAKAPAQPEISRAPGDSPDWISINPDHGDDAGTYTITITLLPNETGANRTATIIISCNGTEVTITVTQKGENQPGTGTLTELTSPITVNTTLKDLGLPVDYVYKGGNFLTVQNNAVLTIEPGVTIQFTSPSGGIYIWDGATLKANGTAAKPIKFIGPTDSKGSWQGVEIYNKNNNELSYVQILNAGGQGGDRSAALYVDEGNVSMTNCLIDNSLTYGISFGSGSGSYRSEFTKFSNNTISNCGKAPIRTIGYADCYNLRNMDKTNTFTGNVNEYIYIPATSIGNIFADMMLPALNGYPWYFEAGIYIELGESKDLTIEPGAMLLMGAGSILYIPRDSHLIANGTADKHITFKGFKNTT